MHFFFSFSFTLSLTPYLLFDFRQRSIGQAWIDKHVHSLFSIGAPFLGSPQSNRALISGEKMGLDFFLSDREATAMCRSWGSAPMLFQAAPEYYPKDLPQLYTRIEALLEISIMEVHLPEDFEGVELYFQFERGENVYISDKKTVAKNVVVWGGETFSMPTSHPLELQDSDTLRITLNTKDRGLINTHIIHITNSEVILSQVTITLKCVFLVSVFSP